MRRSDRQLPQDEAVRIINQSESGILSLSMDNMPYGVPLNPVICGNIIYFHCAKEGLKIDIINNNPYGHFVFVSKCEVIKEKATTLYESVMVHGKLRYVDAIEEKNIAYKALIDRYMDSNITAGNEAIKKYDKATAIIAMNIEGISAKANR